MAAPTPPSHHLVISLADFENQARRWLASQRHRLPVTDRSDRFDVAVFHQLSHEEEAGLIRSLTEWIQAKAECGYHAVDWPEAVGGLGLSKAHARSFARLEAEVAGPSLRAHELVSVTTRLVAPTVRDFGADDQQQSVGDLLAARTLCCQLFSEPGAGSDLASLATSAQRNGSSWEIRGQKVWTSGAQFADVGLLIARTDPGVPKHRGLTAFLMPMNAAGVEVRPIRQMTGGTSFCEVFLDGVELDDSTRLGDVGQGWSVALTTLDYERDHSGEASSGRVGGDWRQVVQTARECGRAGEPAIRHALARLFVEERVGELLNQRVSDLARSGAPGPEGSLGKLKWTLGMTLLGEVVAEVLGPRILADSGAPHTFVWNEHLLGAPGYRIAGGSDEIQRNIIAERCLGLPREPRTDHAVPWNETLR